jgi:hypothetical protein
VSDEIGDTVLRWASAVRAIDGFSREQTPEVIEEFVAFVILAVKHPKTALRFGYFHIFHFHSGDYGAITSAGNHG